MKPGSEPDLLTFPATAKLLGCCSRNLHRYVAEGILPRPDIYCRFRREDVEAARVRLQARAPARPDDDD